MSLPKLPFPRFITSRQLLPGDYANGLTDLLTSQQSGITALAGGGLSSATPQINNAFSTVATVATQGDSVVLPAAKSGMILSVTNNGANAMQVFGNGTDTISGIAGATGVLHFNGTTILYYTTGDGSWSRFVGVGGINPSSEATQFGSGIGTFLEEGNLNRQISAAGISPGATGVDSVLAAFSIPANSFDVAGRGISITAEGSFAATANNKDVKIIFNPATAVVGATVGAGGTTIADTGVVATNNLGWSVQANVFKYGATGSNTQLGLHQQAQIGNAVANLLKPSLMTAVENAAILVAITGNAATAANDIVFNWLEINAMN